MRSDHKGVGKKKTSIILSLIDCRWGGGWEMVPIILLPVSMPFAMGLHCHIAAPAIKGCSPFPQALDLGWPCNLLRPVARRRNVGVQALAYFPSL